MSFTKTDYDSNSTISNDQDLHGLDHEHKTQKNQGDLGKTIAEQLDDVQGALEDGLELQEAIVETAQVIIDEVSDFTIKD